MSMAAIPSEGRGLVAALQKWLPKHSIIGRILYPILEERRSLAAVMTWIGFGIIVAFLAAALLAPVLAPWDPYAFADEKDVPPWSNARILANGTYLDFSLSPWVNMTDGQQIDLRSAYSTTVNDSVLVTNFGVRILRESIVEVAYAVWLDGGGTTPGHYLAVEVSADSGSSWSPAREIRSTEQLVRVDITSQRAWRSANLAADVIQLRFTHRADTNAPGRLSLNFAALQVVWLSSWHWMGTDPLGRDVLSRVLFGTVTSLQIMTIGVVVALLSGFPLGLFSGYLGGRIDRVLVLVMDSLYSFPGLLLAGLIAVLLGKGVVNIGLAVTVIYIPLYFRVTRSQVLSAREELYVEAARALGARPGRILWRYIAYNVLVAVPVIFSLSAADAILTAAGLSYLGLGVEAPTPDWGLDLSAASSRVGVGIWWSSFFPGLAIVVLTVALSFLGEGLNDIVNPVLRRERS